MRFIYLFMLMFTVSGLFAQQFRMAANMVSPVTTVNDSTYTLSVQFPSDLTGNSFYPTTIPSDNSYRIFFQNGKVYTVNSASNVTITNADLEIIEYGGTDGVPAGQSILFDPDGSSFIPQVPIASNGASVVLNAAIVTYNSSVDFETDPIIDSTRLTQDSIIVYFQDGIEVGRDTLSLATPETDPIYAADSAQLKADILANAALTLQQVTHNGNTTTNDINIDGKITSGNTQVLSYPRGSLIGTLIIGNGGQNLLNSAGDNGRYNTYVGIGAGELDSAGFYNTANGYQALYSNTTGIYNTANGNQALYSNTTGGTNTANGFQALYSNTTGIRNTANGFQALYSNTTGGTNTANGYRALYSNTTGIRNTANGYRALYSNTTGIRNTANGYQALYSNTTGIRNTANGYQALYSNTTGIRNTANGYQALYSNTTGIYNTATGAQALYLNTTGSRNTANGYQALYSNTTGIYNTANGYRALYSNTTGIYNTATGYEAGRYIAGNQALDTVSNSVFLGADTKALADNTTNEIVIGYNTTGNGANTVTIGNSSITDNYFQGNMHIPDRLYLETIDEDNTNTSLLAADPLTGEVEERTVASLFSAKIESARNYSATTSGTGSVTVSHSLGVAPSVTVTNASATPYLISISSVTTTDFTILFYDTSGSTVNSTAVNFDYQLIIP